MTFNLIEAICLWNEERNNLNYDTATEFTMLSEELQEYLIAKQKNMLDYAKRNDLDPYSELTFTEMSDEDKRLLALDVKVDEADALADIIFVAVGSLYKLTGGSIINTIRVIEAVLEANNSKGRRKTDGKIQKPKNFVGPEEDIKRILLGKDYVGS